MHPIAEQHPKIKAKRAERALIDQAEAAYKADPELARDLTDLGWDPTRRAAMLQGRAVRGDVTVDHRPVLDLRALPRYDDDGNLLPPLPSWQPTMWSEFQTQRARIDQETAELLHQLGPELTHAARERESELLANALTGSVAELDAAAAEIAGLLGLLRQAAPPPPRAGRYREQVTGIDVLAAARAGSSLLTAVGGGEWFIDLWGVWHPVADPGGTGAGPGRLGVTRDNPHLPPAGVVMTDPPRTREELHARRQAMVEPPARPLRRG